VNSNIINDFAGGASIREEVGKYERKLRAGNLGCKKFILKIYY
jgi:hypothetical protein